MHDNRSEVLKRLVCILLTALTFFYFSLRKKDIAYKRTIIFFAPKYVVQILIELKKLVEWLKRGFIFIPLIRIFPRLEHTLKFD